jgi:hypothetical protein
MTFIIKQNDTSPALLARLVKPDRTAADVSGAAVLFHLRNKRNRNTVLIAPAAVVDGPTGVVRYDWAVGDTQTAGDYEGEFQVTYVDTTVETFPNEGYMEIIIPAELA